MIVERIYLYHVTSIIQKLDQVNPTVKKHCNNKMFDVAYVTGTRSARLVEKSKTLREEGRFSLFRTGTVQRSKISICLSQRKHSEEIVKEPERQFALNYAIRSELGPLEMIIKVIKSLFILKIIFNYTKNRGNEYFSRVLLSDRFNGQVAIKNLHVESRFDA